VTVSAFELFSVGIGPSSSHTVGPMRAARRFAELLDDDENTLESVDAVAVELMGSLALTGAGHGTDRAVLMGLEGEAPETIEVEAIDDRVQRIAQQRELSLLGRHRIRFDPETAITFNRGARPTPYSNALTLTALRGEEIAVQRTFFSVGGGFIVEEAELEAPGPSGPELPHPFCSAAELIDHADSADLPISEVVRRNELALRSEEEIEERLGTIWAAMQECVQRGLTREGVLPGRLGVKRRAAKLHAQLRLSAPDSPLVQLEWVNLYALSVNEENASGGRMVTAPTNGAAGIIPAVLHYYVNFVPGASEEGVFRFLLAATAVGSLCKENASISGADVGCQGEVGTACAMAAAGLCEVLGGTPAQVENAAEIAMEHNLGLTCDPIAGLVQVPCIERNAVASVKAINACQLALRGNGSHFVSLDDAIRTMRETGRDMSHKYKETSLGGLAVNVVEC
jgi:L-serine dehydratase